jgi:hypothetical protein
VLEYAVDHDVEPGKVGGQRHLAAFPQRVAPGRVTGVAFEMHHAGRVDGCGNGGHLPVGENVHDVHAVSVQSGHRAPAGRIELMTAARSGRPYSPVIPSSCMACSTEQ